MRGLVVSCAERPEVVAAYSDVLEMAMLYTESGEAGVHFRREVIIRRSEGTNLMLTLCGGGS